MNQRGFSPIFLLIGTVVIIAIVAGVYYFGTQRDSNPVVAQPQITQSTPPQNSQNSTNATASSTPNSNTGLANPASVNCAKQGGQSQIVTKKDGSQYGVCEFEDDQECEEWALYRGECPVGGVKTIGFDTQAQIYCAITGGQTLAVPDAKCTLPSGQVCSAEAYYNGKCPKDPYRVINLH